MNTGKMLMFAKININGITTLKSEKKVCLQKQKVSTERRTLAFPEFQNTTWNIVFMKKVPSLPLHLDYM